MQCSGTGCIGMAVAVAISNSRAAAQSTPGAPTELVGCYGITKGPWSRPLGVNGEYHQVPLRIELDSARAAREGWVLRPDIVFPGGNEFPGTPRWTATADSVQLLWSNGYQPTWMRLVRRSATELAGEAVVGSDANEFGDDPPRALVKVRRIPCR
jgi:hypothetical protein